jgi:hypothetical protein
MAFNSTTAERFRQELDGARLHGLDRRHVAVTRDEDDRHVNPVDGNALLQFETIDVRKSHVKYTDSLAQAPVGQRNSADANVSGCQPAEPISN